MRRLGWFGSIKYEIGGLDYSADDMEHGILRGNAPTAASLSVLVGHPEWSKGFFKNKDPRLKQVSKILRACSNGRQELLGVVRAPFSSQYSRAAFIS